MALTAAQVAALKESIRLAYDVPSDFTDGDNIPVAGGNQSTQPALAKFDPSSSADSLARADPAGHNLSLVDFTATYLDAVGMEAPSVGNEFLPGGGKFPWTVTVWARRDGNNAGDPTQTIFCLAQQSTNIHAALLFEGDTTPNLRMLLQDSNFSGNVGASGGSSIAPALASDLNLYALSFDGVDTYTTRVVYGGETPTTLTVETATESGTREAFGVDELYLGVLRPGGSGTGSLGINGLVGQIIGHDGELTDAELEFLYAEGDSRAYDNLADDFLGSGSATTLRASSGKKDALVGSNPPDDPLTAEFGQWVLDYHAARYGRFTSFPRERRTTIYIDPVDGDDSNDGSEANPLATITAADDYVTLTEGDLRVRLARNADYTELGTYEWQTGYFAVLHSRGYDGVVVDTYVPSRGDGPINIHHGDSSTRVTSGPGVWTSDGNAYYASVDTSGVASAYGLSELSSTLGLIHGIYREDDPFTVFSRATSIANCKSTDQSYYWDKSGSIYINPTGTGISDPGSYNWRCIPRGVSACFILDSDQTLLDLDDSRGGAHGFGWGLDRDDSNHNTHRYVAMVDARDDHETIVANVHSYYHSSHGIATWDGGSSAADGIVSFIRCGGGLFDPDANGGRVINAYSRDGGLEVFAEACTTDQPIMGSSEYFPAFDGHSGGGNEIEFAFTWSMDATGGLPSVANEADETYPTSIHCYAYHRTDEDYAPNGSQLFHTNHVYISCEFSEGISQFTTAASLITNLSLNATAINCVINLDLDDDADRISLCEENDPSDDTIEFHHCLIRMNVPTAVAASRTSKGAGIYGDIVNSNSTNVSGGKMQGCVLYAETTAGRTAYAAFGNTTAEKGNAYFNIDADGDGQSKRGYDSTTDPVTLSETPASGFVLDGSRPIPLNELRRDRETYDDLEYDWALLDVSASPQLTMGPIVASSPGGYYNYYNY